MKNKFGFTLAEVLITFGIIGVVAAITIPTLIKNYQKQVFYTQFRKAATTIENALKLYAVHNGCEGEIANCFDEEKYGRFVFEHNYENVCKDYKIKSGFNTNDIYYENGCENVLGISSTNHAFITTDGMLFNFATDLSGSSASMVDVNGLKKPNALGRDIFVFYLLNDGKSGIMWSGNESQNEDWGDDYECSSNDGQGCAAKLLKEGKMNY